MIPGTVKLIDHPGKEIAGDVLSEVAPGTWTASALPSSVIPKHGFISLVPGTDGRLIPGVKGWAVMKRLSRAADWGVDISYDTLLRLWQAGFIRGSQPSPRAVLIDLESFWEHIRATASPDFWTPERLEKMATTARTGRSGYQPPSKSDQ